MINKLVLGLILAYLMDMIPCTELFKDDGWLKTYRTYLNCEEKSTYIDSIYTVDKLYSTQEFVNNKENGNFIYYDNTGKITMQFYYKNGFAIKSCYYDDYRNYCIKYENYNDTLSYLRFYNEQGKLTYEGFLENEKNSGRWIKYNIETGNKTIENWLPKTRIDSIYTIDSTTWIQTLQVISTSGTLDGYSITYDKNDSIIRREYYINGVKQ